MEKNMYNDKTIVWQRVIYTLCFFSFCIIDWMKGSLNGRIQMTATNVSGIVFAMMIMCMMGLRSFSRPVYIVWTAVVLVCMPIGICVSSSIIPYRGQVISAAINIALYGYIWIKILLDIIVLKRRPKVKLFYFSIWILMLLLMYLSINENIWPLWYATSFGAYYIIDCDIESEKIIYVAAVDGIILGFFILQGLALVFRPYDIARYQGIYINPNFNALFYIMSYSAFLSKNFYFRKYKKNIVLRLLTFMFSGAMFGFAFFSGSKAALVTMIMITAVFMVLSARGLGCSFFESLKYCACLGAIGIASIPIIYFSIRWIPTVHLHPLYFEGEYSEYRILPGEQRDSEKYVSFEEAMEENAGRVFYMLPNISKIYNGIFVMRVYAAAAEDDLEEQSIFSYEDIQEGINPVKLRYEIYKYYVENLNLFGHSNNYHGAQIYPYYVATHAHNVFIQMAFLYGLPAGFLFLLMVLSYIPGCTQLFRNNEYEKVCVIVCFTVGFVIFGLFEIDWMCGQLPFTMFFVLYRDVIRKHIFETNQDDRGAII